MCAHEIATEWIIRRNVDLRIADTKSKGAKSWTPLTTPQFKIICLKKFRAVWLEYLKVKRCIAGVFRVFSAANKQNKWCEWHATMGGSCSPNRNTRCATRPIIKEFIWLVRKQEHGTKVTAGFTPGLVGGSHTISKPLAIRRRSER